MLAFPRRFWYYRTLEIVTGDFKVALAVLASGANFGGSRTYHNMTAVAAFPDLDLALFKDLGRFHIVQQRTVAFFMALLNGRYQAELGRQFREAFLLGSFGKASYMSVHS